MAVLFYIFGAGALVSAIVLITRRSPLMSALALAVCFLSLAGLFALLSAPLVAALQILISAGAVVVLILFVVMLVDVKREVQRYRLVRFGKIIGAAGAAYLAIVIMIAAAAPPFVGAPATGGYYRSAQTLGIFMLERYAVAFELTGVLLLAACVAAVAIGKREGEAPAEDEEDMETI